MLLLECHSIWRWPLVAASLSTAQQRALIKQVEDRTQHVCEEVRHRQRNQDERKIDDADNDDTDCHDHYARIHHPDDICLWPPGRACKACLHQRESFHQLDAFVVCVLFAAELVIDFDRKLAKINVATVVDVHVHVNFVCLFLCREHSKLLQKTSRLRLIQIATPIEINSVKETV